MNVFSLYPFLMEILFGQNRTKRHAPWHQKLTQKPWFRKLSVMSIMAVFFLAWHLKGVVEHERLRYQKLRERAVYYKAQVTDMSQQLKAQQALIEACKAPGPAANPATISQALAAKAQKPVKPKRLPPPAPAPSTPMPATTHPSTDQIQRRVDKLKQDSID